MVSNYEQQQQLHVEVEVEVEVSSSSRGTNNNNSNSSTLSLISHKRNKLEDSDEDLFTVPDVETQQPMDSMITDNGTQSSNPEIQNQKRRRGRNPVDKEHRRLKRLLRNRVSAQQARERKKVYVNDLELRAKELHDVNSKLEEKISTLINENTMLRKILMNTRPKVDESNEQKQDRLSKS